MLRTLVLAATLLLAGLSTPVSAEEVRVGPCELDGCVYLCVRVTEACHGDELVCTFWAFRLWCFPGPLG